MADALTQDLRTLAAYMAKLSPAIIGPRWADKVYAAALALEERDTAAITCECAYLERVTGKRYRPIMGTASGPHAILDQMTQDDQNAGAYDADFDTWYDAQGWPRNEVHRAAALAAWKARGG